MESTQIVRILYSAAALQGIFLVFLLARSKNNQPANRILSALLALMSFHLVLVGFDDREFFMTFPHLSRISWIIGTLYWPLLFLFVSNTIQVRTSIFTKILFFIPFIFFLIVMLPYYSLSAEVKRVFLQDFERASREDFGWINQTVSVLHIFFQGGLLLFYLYSERKLKEEYSEIESVRVQWLRGFLILIFAITTLAVISFFARNFNWPVISDFYNFHFIGVVILFYWLSYNALTHPVLFDFNNKFDSQKEILPEAEKVSNRQPDEKTVSDFIQTRQVLVNEKLYTKPNLTLTELSEKANLPRHQVSQAINSQYKGNFFDLVNDLRIEEFKRLVKDPSKKNLTLLGIAQESGFNSKASFYAIFKKKTGMTPSEFAETGV